MVQTKNALFEGKTLGVKFERGRALVDDVTVDPKLGRSKDEVATLMKRDFGYEVEPVAHSKMVAVPELPWKRGEEGVGREAGGVGDEAGSEGQDPVTPVKRQAHSSPLGLAERGASEARKAKARKAE